jgi:signal transduction histidine kinase
MQRESRSIRWPWFVLCSFGAAALAGIPMSIVNGTNVGDDLPFVVAFGAFGLVGALIASRDPGNRIGYLLLYGSVAAAAGFLASELATLLVDEGVRAPIVLVPAAILGEAAWVIGMLPVLVLLPLLFPDGQLPSPRWRPFLVLTGATLAFIFLSFALGSATLTGASERTQIPNPLFVPAISSVVGVVEAVFFWAFLGILAASVASLVVRFVRSRGVERQQIKWFALAVVFLLVVVTVSELLLVFGIESRLLDMLLIAPAFLFLPVSVGTAVLRYRLWELDVVVKKALVAGTLVVLAIAVYAGAVALIGVFASDRESTGTLFLIALALGFAFRPVMRVARRVADRLVYGRRATPYEVLTEFSERVGTSYATEDVLPRMAQVLGEGTGAETARVWLCVGGEFRPAAAWPSDAPAVAPVRTTSASFGIAGETVAEVRDKGELLGALSVRMPASDPMSPSKDKLMNDLAAQAGLVLRNVRLVEDVRASRQRLAAAQDEERRRLERNIHDGAQQQLVALAVKARLARQLTDRDPAKAAEMLAQIEAETQTALEDLRDLVRGI